MREACQQVEIGNRGVGGWRGRFGVTSGVDLLGRQIGEGGIYIYSRPARSRDGGGLADFLQKFCPGSACAQRIVLLFGRFSRKLLVIIWKFWCNINNLRIFGCLLQRGMS